MGTFIKEKGGQAPFWNFQGPLFESLFGKARDSQIQAIRTIIRGGGPFVISGTLFWESSELGDIVKWSQKRDPQKKERPMCTTGAHASIVIHIKSERWGSQQYRWNAVVCKFFFAPKKEILFSKGGNREHLGNFRTA